MRIIGGYDYYDSSSYGRDDAITFVRSPERHLSEVQPITGHPFPQTQAISIVGNHNLHQVGVVFLFFVSVAGEYTPGVARHRFSSNPASTDGTRLPDPGTTEFFYTLEDAFAALREDLPFLRYDLWMRRAKREKSLRATIEKRFSKTALTQPQLEWVLGNKATIVSSYLPFSPQCRRDDQEKIQINHSCLQELEFYRVMDPFTANMRIANFVGGTLTETPCGVEISDRSKIIKAGFDPKSSFRKAKPQ